MGELKAFHFSHMWRFRVRVCFKKGLKIPHGLFARALKNQQPLDQWGGLSYEGN